MKLAFNSIVAAAAFVVAGAASAAGVTVVAETGIYNDLKFTGSGTLSFSAATLEALDVAKVGITGFGAATANVQLDSEGYYLSASASAPIASLTIDSTTNAVLGAATSGGAVQTSTTTNPNGIRNVIQFGTSLTVTDLTVDLVAKTVTGTIFGSNGLTPKTEVLWTIGSITGDSIVTGPGTYNTTLGDLRLTTDAVNDFSIGLGLLATGKTTLGALKTFGSIQSMIVATAVPEPSTSAYALIGLSLMGVALSKRRRTK
jgi:hypothetical protein